MADRNRYAYNSTIAISSIGIRLKMNKFPLPQTKMKKTDIVLKLLLTKFALQTFSNGHMFLRGIYIFQSVHMFFGNAQNLNVPKTLTAFFCCLANTSFSFRKYKFSLQCFVTVHGDTFIFIS